MRGRTTDEEIDLTTRLLDKFGQERRKRRGTAFCLIAMSLDRASKTSTKTRRRVTTRLEKVPSIFKEGLYGFVESLTKLPGGYLDSVKEQAYADLRSEFSQKLEGDSKRSISDEIFSRGRGLIYDFYRSEIENDIGLKNSFFDSGTLNVALRTKEELEPARQELSNRAKSFVMKLSRNKRLQNQTS